MSNNNSAWRLNNWKNHVGVAVLCIAGFFAHEVSAKTERLDFGYNKAYHGIEVEQLGDIGNLPAMAGCVPGGAEGAHPAPAPEFASAQAEDQYAADQALIATNKTENKLEANRNIVQDNKREGDPNKGSQPGKDNTNSSDAGWKAELKAAYESLGGKLDEKANDEMREQLTQERENELAKTAAKQTEVAEQLDQNEKTAPAIKIIRGNVFVSLPFPFIAAKVIMRPGMSIMSAAASL